MFVDDSTIEEIKNRIDIFDIISASVKLTLQGKNAKGLCPFHNEKTPSFIVNRERQSYHCFGCNASGDVISFIRESQGLTFTETIEKLASIAGIQLKQNEKTDPNAKKRNDLYKINSEAMTKFSNNLLDIKTGEICLKYLSQRGISHETIDKFKIGFAVNSWDNLIIKLQNSGFSSDILQESGLAASSLKSNKIYDKFRNRLMFPILNSPGNVVGFSGRSLELDNKNIAKYMNSPENIIFKKSQLLFGMSLAKSAISRLNLAILGEGHIDICMLHQYGFNNSLGVQGTALTPDHLQWISKYTKNITLLFDGDPAGIKAALRVLPVAFKQGLAPKIAILPNGEDPASFLLKYGKTDLENVLNKAISLFDFKIQFLINKKPLTPELKNEIAHQMIDDILNVKNPVLSDSLKQHLASSIQVNLDSLSQEYFNIMNKKSIFKQNQEKIKKDSSPSLRDISFTNSTSSEKELIKILLSNSSSHKSIFQKIDFNWIQHKLIKDICCLIFKCFCEKQFNQDKIISKYQKSEKIFMFLKEASQTNYGDKLQKAIKDTLLKLESNFLIKKRDSLIKKIEYLATDNLEYKETLKEIDTIKKALTQISQNS